MKENNVKIILKKKTLEKLYKTFGTMTSTKFQVKQNLAVKF